LGASRAESAIHSAELSSQRPNLTNMETTVRWAKPATTMCLEQLRQQLPNACRAQKYLQFHSALLNNSFKSGVFG
jgi:hypothetical protein